MVCTQKCLFLLNYFLTSFGSSPAGPGNFLFAEWRLNGVTGKDGILLLHLLFTEDVGVELFIAAPDTELVTVLVSGSCDTLLVEEGTEQCLLLLNDECWLRLSLVISFSDAGFFEGGRPSESITFLWLLREKENVFSFWLDDNTGKLHLGESNDLSPVTEMLLYICNSGMRWVLALSEASLTLVWWDPALGSGVLVFQEHSSSSKNSCAVAKMLSQIPYSSLH